MSRRIAVAGPPVSPDPLDVLPRIRDDEAIEAALTMAIAVLEDERRQVRQRLSDLRYMVLLQHQDDVRLRKAARGGHGR